MSRRSSSRNAGNGAQLQRMGIMDPMAEVHQMMRGFGGIHDGFMRDMMMPFGRDPFEDMFKFSDSTSLLTQSIRTCTRTIGRDPSCARLT